MRKIQILDCTLRDGGRLFNCEFSNEMIKDVSFRLQEANIDIIEVGFLRDANIVNYKGNSTFFTEVGQIKPFLPLKKNRKALYVAFIDYGMFDFDTLDYCDDMSVDGIRFGFTHKDLAENRKEVFRSMDMIKEKGYKLFVQNVNTPGYTDRELLDLVSDINKILPYSYGIVDTYGSMYEEDLGHYFYMIDKNLSQEIQIDFHSHNNFQMSFALALKMIKLCSVSERKIIIDATLNGMGKGAGNLNLELIVDYLVRKRNYNYELECLLDIIDDYLKDIKKSNSWGYSLPGLFSGIYRCHPNNMLYLTEKFDLASKDIKTILSSVEPEKRERYDYDNLQKVCAAYLDTKTVDTSVYEDLRADLKGKNVLLVMPGPSIRQNYDLEKYVNEHKSYVISVNFFYKTSNVTSDMCFFGSADRYRSYRRFVEDQQVVLTSNIKSRDERDRVVNYEGVVERGNSNFDNSTIMCLNLLKKCEVKSIVLAGFDGYSDGTRNYYQEENPDSERSTGKSVELNKDIQEMFTHFCKTVQGEIDVQLLTPSIYKIPQNIGG